jgi:hypothetical protein
MDAPNRNILVWNVRGLNNPSRRTTVRAAVLDAMPSIVCVCPSLNSKL